MKFIQAGAGFLLTGAVGLGLALAMASPMVELAAWILLATGAGSVLIGVATR